jgi:FkbM family methyltransferase
MKKFFIRALNKFGIVESFNLTFETIINNRAFKIPLIKKTGFEHIRIHEPWMIELLTKILEDRGDKTYVDVGVNLGQTLIKLRSVNWNIRYYGFEPNPICVGYVRELAKTNEFKNVVLFPIGISNKTDLYELSFFSDDESDPSASILSDFRINQKTYQKEYIACFNVAGILNKCNLSPIGVIKIDVEGAEKEVLEGLKEKIITDQPLIQLEILPVYDEEHKERMNRQTAIENLFREINYTKFRIHIDEKNNLAGLEEIETIGIHSNMNWCEYLVVPDNLKTSFQNMQ